MNAIDIYQHRHDRTPPFMPLSIVALVFWKELSDDLTYDNSIPGEELSEGNMLCYLSSR